jgi:pSer/pThr/pTyr-binding forkhead associated (FHA) protein
VPGHEPPGSDAHAVGELVGYKLRYRSALISLRAGKIYIGRSPQCELAISDPAVSRRHARLWINPVQIVIEDLGSSNGVLINGERIQGPRELRHGDVIKICTHELELVEPKEEEETPKPHRYHITAQTVTGAEKATLVEDLHDSQTMLAARSVQPSMRLSQRESPRYKTTSPPGSDSLAKAVATLAETLERGDFIEVTRQIGPVLSRIHELFLDRRPVGHELVEHVVKAAARLATETKNPTWISEAVELYAVLCRPLPESALTALHGFVQHGEYPDMELLAHYVAGLATHVDEFDEGERFVLDSLRRIVASY